MVVVCILPDIRTWFWTIFLNFVALYPFSLWGFVFSLTQWLDFGHFRFLAFPYVHFHYHVFGFLHRRQWILDYFLMNCPVISIFSTGACVFHNAMTWLWTFSPPSDRLCPFWKVQLAILRKIPYDELGHATDGSRVICVGAPTGSMWIKKGRPSGQTQYRMCMSRFFM